MDDSTFTYEEFSKALRQVSEKLNELSDTLDDIAAKVVEAWQKVFSESMYTYEALGELATVFDKISRKKLPRPSYKRVKTCTYGYIKTFQRNLPYQRRNY